VYGCQVVEMEPAFIEWLRTSLSVFMRGHLSDEELPFAQPSGSVDDKTLSAWKSGIQRLQIKVAPYLRLKFFLVLVVLVDVVS
jgi:hypothetical protein